MKISSGKVALSILLTASLSNAAVTLDAFTGAQVNYSTPLLGGPLTWSHTVGVGSDRALLVGIGYEDNGSATAFPSSVTFGSQSLALVGTVDLAGATPGFRNAVALWYLDDPTAGMADITVGGLTLTVQNNDVKGYAGSFFNVAGYEKFATSATSGGASLLFQGLTAGSAVFSAANNQNNTPTWTTSLTSPAASSLGDGGSSLYGGYSLNLPAGDTTVTYGVTSGRTPALGVVLTPVPEPSTAALALLGLSGLLVFRKRR